MSEMTCKVRWHYFICTAERVVTSRTRKRIIGVLKFVKWNRQLHASGGADCPFAEVTHDQFPAIHAGIAPL